MIVENIKSRKKKKKKKKNHLPLVMLFSLFCFGLAPYAPLQCDPLSTA
jgi:hypothetical protein